MAKYSWDILKTPKKDYEDMFVDNSPSVDSNSIFDEQPSMPISQIEPNLPNAYAKKLTPMQLKSGDARTSQQVLQDNLLESKTKMGAFGQGFSNSALLGIPTAFGGDAARRTNEVAQSEHPWAYKIGEFAGSSIPASGILKVASPLTKTIENKLLKSIVQGGLVGGGLAGGEDIIAGKDFGTITQDTLLNGAFGGALGGGLYKVGEAISPYLSKILPKKQTAPVEPLNTVESPNTIRQGESVNLTELLNQSNRSEIPNQAVGATNRTQLVPEIVSSEQKTPFNLKDKWNDFYTRTIDTMNPLKKIDEPTYQLATNSKSVGGTVDHIIKNNLVDMQGNKLGESLQAIAKNIPKSEQDSFMNYVLQKHNIDRAREGKPIDSSFTSEESEKAIQILDQKFPQYKALADRLIKFVSDFESEWGNKSGLIKDDLWNELKTMYPNYVPTQRSFSKLEQGLNSTNGKGFVDQSNTIKKATGSDRDIINPIENIMNLVNKTVRTARYNEVGQSFVKALESNPNLRSLAEIIPEGEKINPNVNNVVSVLVKGEPVNIKVNDIQLLEALQGLYKNPNVNAVEQTAKKLTGAFKQLITQKNPVFALRNIARDVPTYLVNSTENNPLKAISNLGGAVKDVLSNGENLQRYNAVGGGGGNFFNSSQPFKTAAELSGDIPLIKKVGHGLMNGIEKFNNLTETAPRLAEFNSVLGKTGDAQKALYAANDVTTNFSRGGDITKNIDSYVPYLNAGVQGLDKLVRQFVNKPIATVLKGATAITAPTLILNEINKDNPNYKDLDNRTKDNYFLIPKEDGTFFKIPKSRELGVLFSSLLERTLRAKAGEENAFKGFGNTVETNFSPANPFDSNIASPLMSGLPSNKDFANRTIVPQSMQDRSPKLQYDEKTTELAKAIGDKTNLSPKQIDYILKSYTGVIYQLASPVMIKNDKSNKTIDDLLSPVTSQFKADPVYNNQNMVDFYDNLDMLKTKAADKNFLENIPSKVKTKEEAIRNAFQKSSENITKLNKEIKIANEQDDQEKVKQLKIKILEQTKKANSLLR